MNDRRNVSLKNLEYMLQEVGTTDQRLSRSGYIIAGLILVGITVLGVVSNLCVILVICRNRRLRTPINLMLLSLSFSEQWQQKYRQFLSVLQFIVLIKREIVFFLTLGDFSVAAFGKSEFFSILSSTSVLPRKFPFQIIRKGSSLRDQCCGCVFLILGTAQRMLPYRNKTTKNF